MTESSAGPSGIGGWLILPLIGMCLTIVLTVINLVIALGPQSIEGFKNIFSAGGGLESLRIPVIASMASGVFIVVYTVFTLSNFLTKSLKTPKLMIVMYMVLVATNAIDFMAASKFDEVLATNMAPRGFSGLLRSGIVASIWIPYFMVSVRVKNTFGGHEESIPEVFD